LRRYITLSQPQTPNLLACPVRKVKSLTLSQKKSINDTAGSFIPAERERGRGKRQTGERGGRKEEKER